MPRQAYSRTPESNTREQNMRGILAPHILGELGTIVSNKRIKGMHVVAVERSSGPTQNIWVKCAWKPGNYGNCAVQMDFPSKENRAKTDEDVVRIVTDKCRRAEAVGATHLLLLSADDAGHIPSAAYLLPMGNIETLIRRSVELEPDLTRNGASPSIYIEAIGERQKALVEIVRDLSEDVLHGSGPFVSGQDAIQDLDFPPAGALQPPKLQQVCSSYARDPSVRAYVIRRAKNNCEYCGELGFLMADGKSHYLEAHHIISLANEGHDTPSNVIALCPKHHKEAHYGADREILEDKMIKIARSKL